MRASLILNGVIAAIFLLLAAVTHAKADDIHNSIVGVQGYDLVSYHTNKRPNRGNGNHVVTHQGVNYLFASDANKKTFAADPEKYLPAYGGFCAYGVAVGKKFIADPEIWEIVDGKLYLNLDNTVRSLWVKDIPGHIKTADQKWPEIKDIAPNKL